MQKTVTLTPKYITSDSSFTGVLNGGEDYRTFKNDGVEVGTIVFSSIGRLSTACVLDYYSVSFEQKCNRASIPEMWWTLTPKKISTYSVSGSTISIISSSNFGSAAESRTNGTKYLSKTCSFGVSSNQSDIFSGALLGFYLSGDTDRTANSQLYMKGLSASVTYTARYKAKFYDDDGTLLDTQTLDAGVSPTAPTLSREGYYVRWEKDGVEYAELPSGTDTDIIFNAVYHRIVRTVGLKKPQKGALELYIDGVKRSGETLSNIDYYSVNHGDSYTVKAIGCNTTAEDLSFKVTDTNNNVVSTSSKDGSSSTTLEFTDTATQNVFIEVSAVPVYFTIQTSKTGEGTITSSHQVQRHSNATVTITPNESSLISTVEKDGVSQTVTATGMTVLFTDVTSNHSVEVAFAKKQFSVAFDVPNYVTVKDGNNNTISGSATVEYGDSPVFTLSCDTDHSLTNVTVDNETLLSDVFKAVTSYSVELYLVTGNHSVTCTGASVVTVSIEQTEGGTVSCADFETSAKFVANGSLRFIAKPNTAYVFSKWYDDSTAATKTLTLDENTPSSVTVSATFEEASYHLEYTINGEGDVDPKPEYVGALTGEGIRSYAYPNEGWVLSTVVGREKDQYGNWGDYSDRYRSMDGSYWLTGVVYGDTQYIITFVKNIYRLTIASSEESCAVEVKKDGEDYPVSPYALTAFETELSLKAIPAEGWHFVRWSDNNSGNAERTFTMPAKEIDVQAIFAKDTFYIETSSSEGGTLTESYLAEYGDDCLITFTADYCYKLKDVIVDGASQIDKVTLTRRGGTLLLQSVKDPHKIEAVYEKRMYQGYRLLDYYPPVIASIEDIQKLMKILQVTDDALWDSASFLMENQFIDTATNEGVTMWERELGIIPEPTDTLADRKARLKLKWVPNNRFTMKWLHKWLKDSCGVDVEKPTVKDYTLTVVLPWFVQWKNVFQNLEQYKPANIVLSPTVRLPSADKSLMYGFAQKTEFFYTVNGSDDLLS